MKKIRQNINQSWQIIKQNKLYSFFYILGTALAISMVLVIAIGYNIKVGNIYPQVNRDRTLVLHALEVKSERGATGGGGFSDDIIKKLVTGVEGIEAICINAWLSVDIQKDLFSEAKKELIALYNAGAWQVYQYDFVEGRPFTKEDVEALSLKAVISASTAKSFFGEKPAVGEKIWIDYKEYTICGVVKDVSNLNSTADVYIPYKNYSRHNRNNNDSWGASNASGPYYSSILAKSQQDFDRIKIQIQENLAKINNTLDGVELGLLGGPFSFIESSLTINNYNREKTSPQKYILQLLIIVLIIIMIPAINLSGIISTEMEDRESEVGIRKAFGASRGRLLYRLLSENVLLSFIGGILGILFSYLFIYIGYQLFLIFLGYGSSSRDDLNIGMLLNYKVILVAFISCLLINLCSSIVPQYLSTRKNIISLLQRNNFVKKRKSARQKSVWIFFELLAVFVITWMMIDPLYVLNYQKSIYDGFEHKGLYRIDIRLVSTKSPKYKEETPEENTKNQQIILNIIKSHPFVENVGRESDRLIMHGYGDNSEIKRSFDDSLNMDVNYIQVAPYNHNLWAYGFKTTEKLDEKNIQNNTVLLSKSVAKKLFGDSWAIGKNVVLHNGNILSPVIGVVDDIKTMQYEQPKPFIICIYGYEPYDKRQNAKSLEMTLLVRSKPNISEAKFIQTITEDLKGKINIGARYLSLIETYFRDIEYRKRFTITPQKNIYTLIACFVLVNMFLGIFATFWLQSKKRRGEIGLRMAMGSSKKKVSRMFVMESVKMASLASLVGLIVVGNIVYFKGMFTYGEFQNPVYWAVTNNTAHFIIVSLIAYAVILLTVTLGTLIPASKAANTNPVDALRDE